MNYTFEQYRESADFFAGQAGRLPAQSGYGPGPGLGYLGDVVENPIVVPYGEIPPLKHPLPPGTRGSWSAPRGGEGGGEGGGDAPLRGLLL